MTSSEMTPTTMKKVKGCLRMSRIASELQSSSRGRLSKIGVKSRVKNAFNSEPAPGCEFVVCQICMLVLVANLRSSTACPVAVEVGRK